MIVVSNSSPIIFLWKIKKLDLLFKLYKSIHIPKKVFEELSKEKDDYFESYLPNFEVEKIEEKLLSFQLHEGESEAINLAIKKKANLILLDDKKARIVAKSFGIKIKGTLGLLLTFLDNKLVSYDEFKTLLDELIKLNFRIHIDLYNEALKEAENISKIYKLK